MSKVSAVLVTTGAYDLAPIIENIEACDFANEIIIWNNAERAIDAKVYGRYLAIAEAEHDFIYVQDDDCLPHEPQSLTPSAGSIVANMPRDRHGDRITLLGWGAVFHRSLPERAFREYLRYYPMDDLFLRTCDVVFSTFTASQRLDLGVENLPWAFVYNRMHRQPDHYNERDAVRSRCDRLLRGVVPA